MKRIREPLRHLILFVPVLILVGAQPGLGQAAPPMQFPISCSPAPCVLHPTEASEGGSEVTDPVIAADPLNPAQLLLGSIDFNCQYGPVVFFSSDSGSIWSKTCLTQSIGLKTPSGGSMVGFDRNGTAYAAAGYAHSGYHTGLIGIQSSTDGINWSSPVIALQEQMFPFDPWLAVDTNPGSPFVDNIYISAIIGTGVSDRLYVSHSLDGGNTWQSVAVAPAQFPPKFDNYTNLAAAKDGTLYLSWMYCVGSGSGPCGDGASAYAVLSKSGDGGNTWTKPKPIALIALIPGLNILPNTNIGMTFYPVLGVDNSNGPYAGRIYAATWTWTGSYMRVQVIHSSDGGTTWSKPVPVAPPSANHDQFFPWLSVSPTGLVGVSWLDRRNDPANINYQAFAAISSDGGQSFQPNVQLTTKFSNPNVNGYFDNLFMGDFSGNTWAGPNYFIAAWMDSSNGVDMQDVVGGIRLH